MITGKCVLLCILIQLVMGKDNNALLEIVIHRSTGNGEYTFDTERIEGHFSSAGSRDSAEGPILQIHPMSICTQEFMGEKYEYGWVGVMKLEDIPEERNCVTLYQQAKKAIQRGATAVVFDISEVPDLAKQLIKPLSEQLDRPVIVLYGHQANHLMKIIRTTPRARARIFSIHTKDSNQETHTKEYFDMGIFVAVFVIFCIICIIVVLKLKWRHREQQTNNVEEVKRAVAKLETRKYKLRSSVPKEVHTPVSDICSQSSGQEQCAICLEEYKEAQILRVLPCGHEFHRGCVDPWLVQSGTCPLCMHNIVEGPADVCSEVSPQQPAVSHRNAPQQLYDTPRTSTNNRDLYQRLPQSDFVNYLSDTAEPYHSGRARVHYPALLQRSRIHQGCPSCEGTVGSSPSSCSSYLREYRASKVGNREKVKNVYQNFDDIKYSSAFHRQTICYGCRELGQGHCRSNRYSLLHPHHVQTSHRHSNYTSGISYIPCQTNLCSSSIHNSHGKTYHDRHNDRNFYKYPGHGVRVSGCCYSDSDPECCTGSVKDASIAAQFGSCSSASSSERNHSDSSLECEVCQQLVDSTHSTYGSTDSKDCSDSGSWGSNVFYGGAPDQLCTDASSDQSSATNRQATHSTHVHCSCEECKIHQGSDNHHGSILSNGSIDSASSSDSTLHLSDISGCCGCSMNSSYGNVSVCLQCNSPDLSLSGISGVSTFVSMENLFFDTSHSCDRYSPLPKTISQTRVKDTATVHTFGSRSQCDLNCINTTQPCDQSLSDHSLHMCQKEGQKEEGREEEERLLSRCECDFKNSSSNQHQIYDHVTPLLPHNQNEILDCSQNTLGQPSCLCLHDNMSRDVTNIPCQSAVILQAGHGISTVPLKNKEAFFSTHSTV